MTGSYNNFFRIFDMNQKDVTFEASKDWIKPRSALQAKKVSYCSLIVKCLNIIIFKVCNAARKKKGEVSVDQLDFHSKVLHSAWHPKDNIIGRLDY